MAVSYRAGVVADQATDNVRSRDETAGKAIADRAGVTADQHASAKSGGIRRAAPNQANVFYDTVAAHIAKQASRIPVRDDSQIADGVTRTIERAVEIGAEGADRDKILVPPDIGSNPCGSCVDILRLAVIGGWVHGHQLQLMGIADAVAVFGGQHGEGDALGGAIGAGERAIGVDDDPAVPGSAR